MKTVREQLKELYILNGKRLEVSTLRGKKHEIYLSDNNEYLYSDTGLGKNNFLYLNWFDGVVDFIKQNGGRVEKGNCRDNSKVGFEKCTKGTLSYYIATECYGKRDGESSFCPIPIVAAILDNAGICKNERGYISLR